MVEYINEPVSVEVRFYESQNARPLAFVWKGHRYQIESWGRDNAVIREGRAVQCYLVQTAHQETWELCQDKETAQWVLARHWAERYRVV
jgi:hypothetical protein